MAFQDWDLPNKIYFNWRKGTALPPAIVFNAKIRDIIGEPEADGFLDFKLITLNHNHPTHTASSTIISASGMPITRTGISADVSVSLNPIVNTYNGWGQLEQINYVSFYITGRSATDIVNNTYTIIFSRTFGVSLSIYMTDQPILLPRKMVFNHRFQDLAPAYQNISIDAGNAWEIQLQEESRYDVQIVSGSLSVQTFSVYGVNFKKITGTGSGTFAIRPSQTYLNGLAVSATPYVDTIGPGYNQTWYNRTTEIAINVLESIDVTALPTSLFYYAIQTVSEAMPQTISITSAFDFTISAPSWAVLSTTSETAGAHDIMIDVIATNLISAGDYNDFINIHYNNGNGNQTFKVPIRYLIDAFVILPYSTTEFNFTLDNKMVSFFTDMENTFFDVLMRVKSFDFFSDTFHEYIIPFKVVLLNYRQKENIGLKIHRVMSRMETMNLLQGGQYKTCEVELTVEEKDITTREVQRSFTLENIKFIAGMTPPLSNGMGILTINQHATRVTQNSMQIVNLLVKEGNYQVVVFKNNVMATSYTVTGLGYNVYSDKIDFQNIEAKQGDVVEYRFYSSSTEFVSKTFLVFPEGNYNNRIIWEDEFKLLSSLQFTGEYNLKTEFDNKNFRKYRDLVEVLENVQTNKDCKLTINTGFILKTEQIAIESLCRAKRAWLVLSETNAIELVPQTKSITSIDSSRELNSFDIEFIINRKSNEEVYTF